MFNKETEYALRGLIYIQVRNMQGHRPGIKEISEEIDAPHFFTGKILQRLVKSGLVESQKGKGGGFFFDPGKDEISLKEVITLTEGIRTFSGCGLGLRECNEKTRCPLHDHFKDIRDSIDKMISGETIQGIAQKISKDSAPLKTNLRLR